MRRAIGFTLLVLGSMYLFWFGTAAQESLRINEFSGGWIPESPQGVFLALVMVGVIVTAAYFAAQICYQLKGRCVPILFLSATAGSFLYYVIFTGMDKVIGRWRMPILKDFLISPSDGPFVTSCILVGIGTAILGLALGKLLMTPPADPTVEQKQPSAAFAKVTQVVSSIFRGHWHGPLAAVRVKR